MVELLGTREVQALCRTLELHPSKKRGQNFVTDPGTVRRIAALGCQGVPASQTVLEIGPGLGSLTLAILELEPRLVAVEIDRCLAQALAQTVAARGADPERLHVMNRDALQLEDETELTDKTRWPAPCALVANLPYNVATPILLHILEILPGVGRAVVMVQAEVAQRLVSRPGERAYGAPSVKLSWWGETKPAFTVSRQVFYPIPNVDSAVVQFQRHDPLERLLQNRVSVSAENLEKLREAAFRLVNAAFNQRRKTLRRSLGDILGDADAAAYLLEKADIDPGLRPERLGILEFSRLAAVGLEEGKL